MSPTRINLLITTFSGLGLPSTLVLPVSRDDSVSDVWAQLSAHLPASRLLLSTASNKELLHSSQTSISEYTSAEDVEFLSLRLSAPLCGGKGGFGSQLRAAGGRMSSKRKRNQGEDNGSSRNLDGRRLRTVNEAKALAEYLAIKPEMDKKEKEKRRKRWEQVIEATEQKQEEIKNGTKGRMDNQWVEDREEILERTRNAVRAAMKVGNDDDKVLSMSHGSKTSEDVMSDSPDDMNGSKESTPPSEPGKPATEKAKQKPKTLFGFDEDDDEFMSSDSESET